MKVSTENDNNFGYEKISILIDNMPLNYIQKLYTTNPELGDNPFIMTIKSRLYVSFNSNISHGSQNLLSMLLLQQTFWW
jgi:hypothetical protein